MKKFVYLGLFLVGAPCVAYDTERIEEAIEQSSLAQVKSQCNKIERDESLTFQARKKLYRNLHALASDTTSLRAESISLVGNWRDAAKTCSGALFATLGLFAIYGGLGAGYDIDDSGNRVRNRKKPEVLPLPIVVGAISEAIGIFLLYKGIKCSTQKAGIDTAKSIEKYLKGKLSTEEAEQE